MCVCKSVFIEYFVHPADIKKYIKNIESKAEGKGEQEREGKKLRERVNSERKYLLGEKCVRASNGHV